MITTYFRDDNTYWVRNEKGYEIGYAPYKDNKIVIIRKIKNKEVREIVDYHNIPSIVKRSIIDIVKSGINLSFTTINGKDTLIIRDIKNNKKISCEIIDQAKEERKRNVKKEQERIKKNKKLKKIAILVALSIIAGALGYTTYYGIHVNGSTAEEIQEMEKEKELIAKAIENLESLGIADELKNGTPNGEYSFSKLGLQDPDPVTVWSYYKAIPKICGLNFVKTNLAQHQFIKSIYYNEGAYSYLSVEQYLTVNGYVNIKNSQPDIKELKKDVELKVLQDVIAGLDSTNRIPNVSIENNNSEAKSLRLNNRI